MATTAPDNRGCPAGAVAAAAAAAIVGGGGAAAAAAAILGQPRGIQISSYGTN